MGLDNFPRRYPCKSQGTAVLDTEGRIDCDATQDAGGCPWLKADLGDGAVYGMVDSAPCWYRGKVGTWMIQAVIGAGAELPAEISGGFYGDDNELTPDYCNALAAWMQDHGELFLSTVPEDERAREAVAYRYAVRWLHWTAEHGDGAKAWW